MTGAALAAGDEVAGVASASQVERRAVLVPHPDDVRFRAVEQRGFDDHGPLRAGPDCLPRRQEERRPAVGVDVMVALMDAEGDVEKLLAINADQYDLVVNGYESASGAVRNHDPEIMVKAFQMVGLGEEDVKAKFPAMYNAFTYGAPPHAGAAPGVDRLVMLLTGEESIREVITFPMNKNAQDLMMGAPTTVDQIQLDTVHIALVEE